MNEITARLQAYEMLKASIMEGRVKPGEHLREEHLAEEYGVSRTPIRQAIRQLADEGLIEIGENKRSYVTDVSPSQLEQMFDVQALLESYSAGLAAARMTDEMLNRIRATQDLLETNYRTQKSEDDRQYLEDNSRFHRAIHACNGNPKLFHIVDKVVDTSYAVFIKIGRVTESETAIDYHRRIISALEARDSEMAQLYMRTHVETVRRLYRALFKEHNSKGGLKRG
jgi:DNA-binding GntR family transcriptional regulator